MKLKFQQALFLLVVLLISYSSFAQKNHMVWVLSSEFTIHGSTSVNSFQCTMTEDESGVPLGVSTEWSEKKLSFEGLELVYNLADFDCGHPMMNEDFRDILQADKYPEFKFVIRDLELTPGNREIEKLDVTADVSVEIAGVSRRFVVRDGNVINKTEQELVFEGSQAMKITDFGIEPPVKYLLVKVKDEIKVDFSVYLRVKTKKDSPD